MGRQACGEDVIAGSRTSLMNCISLKLWGLKKVNIFFDQVRLAEDQTMAYEGDLILDAKGRVWEFISRKDGQLQVRYVREVTGLLESLACNLPSTVV